MFMDIEYKPISTNLAWSRD